jgi:hypothetical protein
MDCMSETPDLSARHPEVQRLRGYFCYEGLPRREQRAARHFAISADLMLQWIPDSPELTVCLRKLLESRECALRCVRDLPDDEY